MFGRRTASFLPIPNYFSSCYLHLLHLGSEIFGRQGQVSLNFSLKLKGWLLLFLRKLEWIHYLS